MQHLTPPLSYAFKHDALICILLRQAEIEMLCRMIFGLQRTCLCLQWIWLWTAADWRQV